MGARSLPVSREVADTIRKLSNDSKVSPDEYVRALLADRGIVVAEDHFSKVMAAIKPNVRNEKGDLYEHNSTGYGSNFV